MTTKVSPIVGRCHCGNLELEFETKLDLEALPLRSDTCAFCAKHGARTTADPQGSVRIIVRDHERLRRYRFGLQTADFLVCKRCGVYLAALLSTPTRSYATLNVNTFDCANAITRAAVPVSYDGESVAQRIARRERNWTPVLPADGIAE